MVRTYQMLKLMESAVNLLNSKHKSDDTYNWILYSAFFRRSDSVIAGKIINQLRQHIQDISYRPYFRRIELIMKTPLQIEAEFSQINVE